MSLLFDFHYTRSYNIKIINSSVDYNNTNEKAKLSSCVEYISTIA